MDTLSDPTAGRTYRSPKRVDRGAIHGDTDARVAEPPTLDVNEQPTRRRLTESSGIPQKARRADLRKNHLLRLEASLAVVLLGMILLFTAPMRFEPDEPVILTTQEVVQVEEVAQTKQDLSAPPPPRPPIPIEVPNDEVLDDEDLNLDVTLDLDEPILDLPPPPPAPDPIAEDEDIETEIFVVVEQMPELIGGLERLYELLEYPEIARQAQLEGLAIVEFVVGKDGVPQDLRVIRSAHEVLDTAALDAVRQIRFTPGKQRGKAVNVKMSLPIRFKLRSAKQ